LADDGPVLEAAMLREFARLCADLYVDQFVEAMDLPSQIPQS
jgi:hypothetical protein